MSSALVIPISSASGGSSWRGPPSTSRCLGTAYTGGCPVSRFLLGSGDILRLAFACRGGAPPTRGGRRGRWWGGGAPPAAHGWGGGGRREDPGLLPRLGRPDPPPMAH